MPSNSLHTRQHRPGLLPWACQEHGSELLWLRERGLIPFPTMCPSSAFDVQDHAQTRPRSGLSLLCQRAAPLESAPSGQLDCWAAYLQSHDSHQTCYPYRTHASRCHHLVLILGDQTEAARRKSGPGSPAVWLLCRQGLCCCLTSAQGPGTRRHLTP